MRQNYGIISALHPDMPIKKILVILAMLAFHAPVKADMNSEGVGACPQCDNSFSAVDKSIDDARNFRNTAMTGNEPQAVSDAGTRLKWAAQCNRFASGNEYGNVGNQIADELASNKFPHLMQGTDDIRALCPGYDSMSDEAKQGLWVTIMGAMAWRESTCGANIGAHKATDGMAVCLFQLNRGHEDEGGKWGPPGLCNKGDGNTEERCTSCAMNYLESQLQISGKLFAGITYWEVLRPNSPKTQYVRNAIRNYALCK